MASTAAGDSTGSSQQRWKSKLSAWAQPRMVSGASNGTIEFSWKRCLTMLTLHVFAPFSTPVGLYLIGIPAMKRSQLLPTSFGAFTNTVGLIMILHTLELVCLVAGLADFVLSIVSTCYLLWFGRQLMIAIKYGYFSDVAWNKFVSGAMSLEEHGDLNLGAWFQPSDDLLKHYLALATVELSSSGAEVIITKPVAVQHLLQNTLATASSSTFVRHSQGCVLTLDLLTSLAFKRTKNTTVPVWQAAGIVLTNICLGIALHPFFEDGDSTSMKVMDAAVWALAMLPWFRLLQILLTLLRLGVVDYQRRLKLLARVEALLNRENELRDDESGVFTGRGIPVVCEGDEVVPMDVLYNVHGWLFMYLVSKRFAESVRVRIQAMYAIWLLTLVFFTGFVTIYYLQHKPYTLELLTLVMVSAVTAFYVARILLYGARINDRGYATALRLHSVVHRLQESAAAATDAKVMARSITPGTDTRRQSKVHHGEADMYNNCMLAVESARQQVLLTTETNPITFLGITASQTLLNSIASLAASGSAVALRYAVPELVAIVRSRD